MTALLTPDELERRLCNCVGQSQGNACETNCPARIALRDREAIARELEAEQDWLFSRRDNWLAQAKEAYATKGFPRFVAYSEGRAAGYNNAGGRVGDLVTAIRGEVMLTNEQIEQQRYLLTEARLQAAEAKLAKVRKVVEQSTRGSTHYEGCEHHHPLCRIAAIIKERTS